MSRANGVRRPIQLLAVVEASFVTGPAKNLLQFAGLARDGALGPPVAVTLATFRRSGQPNGFARAAAEAGVPLHVIPERGAFDLAAFRGLVECIKRTAPDILQTHSVKSHFLVRLSEEWRKRPWLAFHHGYTTTDRKMLVYNQLDRWSLRKATKIVTVSRSAVRQLERTGVRGDRVLVQHNAIEAEWGDRVRERAAAGRAREELGVEAGERVILIVGRLSREKAHSDLVSAVDRLKRQFPGERFRLVVAGDGPERPRILSHVAALGMAKEVLVKGHIQDMQPWYAAADVCVLASVSECSPNALLEALAARIPVVATAVGGVPEMVSHEESALLVPPGDVDSMAEAIDRVLHDPALASRLTANGHALVLSRFSPQARAAWLCELYGAVSERNPQTRRDMA